MRNISVFSGSAHPQLTGEICKRLGIPSAKVTLSKFSNQETNVEVGESVRDVDVYILSSGCGNVNDNFIELLIMIAACRTASARKITVVIPYFPYSRQHEFTNHKYGGGAARVPLTQMDRLSLLDSPMISSIPIPNDVKEPKSPRPTAVGTTDGSLGLVIPNGTADDTSSSASPRKSLANGDKAPWSPTPHPKLAQLKEEAVSNSMDASGRRRFSSISTSQPNIAVTPLAPQAPLERPVTVSDGRAEGKYRHWTAKSGTLIANMLMAAGADHIMTMDLHDPQYQGFFDIPVDNLPSQPLIVKYIREQIPNYAESVIVSPDAGGAKRATIIADKLNLDFALVHKERKISSGTGSRVSLLDDFLLVGDVNGKQCILIDDIADTCYTITRAAKVLVQHGATRVIALITHGIMSGDAVKRLSESDIDEVIVSNTVPQDEHLKQWEEVHKKENGKGGKGKIKVIDIAPVFAEAIRRIHNGESVSFLFDSVPY